MHLRYPVFTYSACVPFTKIKEKMQEFKETSDSRYCCQNELDKACLQHDMAYGDFKDLLRRTISDDVLGNKGFNFAKNSKYNGYRRGIVSMVLQTF